MELRDLRALVATVELGGMTRAAGRLHLVQSAVSQAIKRLEQGLGVTLLERRGDGVRPTEAGAALARHAELILNAVSRAEDDMAAFRGLRSGTVGLGVIYTAAPLLLAPLLQRLHGEHPGLRLHVREGMATQLTDDLRVGALDLVVAFLPFDDDDLASVAVARLGLAIVVGPSHPLAARRRVALAELADQPWVTFPPGNPGRRWLEDACAQAGFRPRAECEVESLTQLEAFVEAGDGIAMIPPRVADPQYETGRLKLLDLLDPVPTVIVGYAHDPRQPSPAVTAVRQAVEQALRGMPGARP